MLKLGTIGDGEHLRTGGTGDKVEVDVVEEPGPRFVYDGIVTVAEFEGVGRKDVGLLDVAQRVVEQLRLLEVFLELGAAKALLDGRNLLREPGDP